MFLPVMDMDTSSVLTTLPYGREPTRWRANNADITWEHAYKQDYGIDINFLKDKLRGSFDYYYEHRTDIMMIDNT